jgi:hypothetical protein
MSGYFSNRILLLASVQCLTIALATKINFFENHMQLKYLAKQLKEHDAQGSKPLRQQYNMEAGDKYSPGAGSPMKTPQQ